MKHLWRWPALRTLAMVILLPLAALVATVAPAWASEPGAGISLDLDRLGHAVQLEAAGPVQASYLAFGERALTHERYVGGGFLVEGVGLQI